MHKQVYRAKLILPKANGLIAYSDAPLHHQVTDILMTAV
ncbi:MAG: hypothetical protein ACI8V0_002953 [Pseudohongiellaceae bacterium]|jgi:hypothetical protein